MIDEKYYDAVRVSIKGNRKGMDTPQYLHSFRVCEILQECGFDYDIVLAGLLHDIMEDGGVSEKGLKFLGCSDEVIDLVEMCTHNNKTKDSYRRWVNMIDGIIDDCNVGAFAIKMADFIDNMRDCEYMGEKKMRRFLLDKGGVFLFYGKKRLGDTKIYRILEETFYEKVKKLK